MHMFRLAWSEMSGHVVSLLEHDEAVKQVKGIAIIDAKAIYDALTSKSQTHSMAEKRTAIELLAYLQDIERNNTNTKWVHGESNIANSMTRAGAENIMLEYMRTFKWKLSMMTSSNVQRREVLGSLEGYRLMNR